MNHRCYGIIRICLWIVIATTAIVFGAIYSMRPFMMDDVVYYISNERWLDTHSPAWLRWPTHIIGMWLETNGRLGDSTNMLWLNVLPAWARGVAEGVAMGGFYGFAVLWLRRLGYNATACVLATAILMFALPWWDAYGLYVVHINYLWACTLLLAGLYFLLIRHPQSKAGRRLLCIVLFLAAAWHEAIGLPLVIAFAIALATKGIRIENRWPVIWGIVGGLYSITSPGILARIGSEHTPDDPFILLTLKTVPFAVVLLAVVVCKLARNPKRLLLSFTEHQCRLGIITAFSLASAAIAVASGFVGRSGLFAQVFALLALAEMGRTPLLRFFEMQWRAGALLSAALLALMMVQTVLTGVYQIRFDNVSKELISKYIASDDGVIIADVPDYRDAPAILLNRVHAFPPQNLWWTQESLKKHRAALTTGDYSMPDSAVAAQPQLTIIPPAVARAVDSLGASPSEPVEVAGGVVLPDHFGAVAVPPGSYPHAVRYKGINALVYVPIPPGSRPWND